jgi:hypothetical protein
MGCDLAESCATVVSRLEEAGATLMAMPASGYSTGVQTMRIDFVREARESYGWCSGRVRPATPDAEAISRMDEAYAWIELIPQQSYVLRRIVQARSLVDPVTDRHIFSWRRIAEAMGADRRAVLRWHETGIATIVENGSRKGINFLA